MKKCLIIVSRWLISIVVIMLAIIQLSGHTLPKGVGLSILFLLAILNTVVLIIERKAK
jgi:hypothetical protein